MYVIAWWWLAFWHGTGKHSQVIVHRDVYFKHFQALSHTVTGMALKMWSQQRFKFCPSKRFQKVKSLGWLGFPQKRPISPRPFWYVQDCFPSITYIKNRFKDPLVAYWLVHVPLHFGNGTGARNQVSPRFPCSQEDTAHHGKERWSERLRNPTQVGTRFFQRFFFFGLARLDTRKNGRTSMIFSSTCQ